MSLASPVVVLRKGALVFLTLVVPLLFALYFGTQSEVAHWVIYLVLGLAFLHVSLHYGVSAAIPRLHLLFLGFFVCLSISSAIPFCADGEPSAGLRLKALVAVFILASVFLSLRNLVRTPSDVRTALRSMDLAGVAIALMVLFSAALHKRGIEFGEVHEYLDGEVRSFGPLGDQVGFILALFAIRGFLRRNWLVFALHLSAMLLTATRGAFIALLVAFVFAGVMRSAVRQKGLAVVAAVTISAVLLAQIGGFLIDRFVDKDVFVQGLDSRLASMTLGLLVFADHPWLGVGFGGFREAVWTYDPHGYFDVLTENVIATTANQAIQTAVDGGVLGLITFAGLIAAILFRMNRVVRLADPLLANEIRSLWVSVSAMVFGNQSAVWLLPDSLVGYMLFLCAGIGCGPVFVPQRHRNGAAEENRTHPATAAS